MNYNLIIKEHKLYFFIYIGLLGGNESDYVYLGHTAFADRMLDDEILMTHETLDAAHVHLEKAERWLENPSPLIKKHFKANKPVPPLSARVVEVLDQENFK